MKFRFVDWSVIECFNGGLASRRKLRWKNIGVSLLSNAPLYTAPWSAAVLDSIESFLGIEMRCCLTYQIRRAISCHTHWYRARSLLYSTLCHCTVLYCTVLYCTVLYCTVLYCTLHCTVLYCTVLHCTVLCCTVLWHKNSLSLVSKMINLI